MSTLDICEIPGNPDIAGVGVRTSVYIQACLAGLNLIYIVHTRLFNQVHRPDALELANWENHVSEMASTTAIEAPAVISPDTDQRSRNAGRNSPSGDVVPQNVDSQLEDAEQYRAFVRANRDYLDMIKVLERGLFMVGFAVIVSAFLEARSTGLTPYHALIILNISQINNWSGFILLVMRGGFRPSERDGLSQYIFITKDSLLSSIPCSLHAIMMSGLGLYFWSDLKPFLKYAVEAEQECQPLTYLWLFGSIEVSNKALRISSLVFYAISAIPIIGLYFLASILLFAVLVFLVVVTLLILVLCIVAMIFALLYHIIFKPIHTFILRPLFQIPFFQKIATSIGEPISRFLLSTYHHVQSYTTGLLVGPAYSQLVTFPIGIFVCAPLVYTIVSTELTIRVNRRHVESGTEDRWTYGQTLAMFTAVVSLALFTHEVVKMAVKWRGKLMKSVEKDGNSTPPGDLEGSTPKPRPLFVERETQTESHDDWLQQSHGSVTTVVSTYGR